MTLSKKTKKYTKYTLIALTPLLALLLWIYATPFPQASLAPDTLTSTVITDRNNAPLREVLNGLEGRSRWLPLNEIDPLLRLATIHAEDQRFPDHLGVDPVAIGRSAVYNVQRRRVFTGASTISQQTVKLLLYRDQPRTLGLKLEEAVWALRLEHTTSKDVILEQYLNRVPYGNQLFGAEAAARMYFGKPASSLSLAQAALLAALPQSPSYYNPYRNLAGAQRRQRLILNLMLERGAITADQHRRAVDEPIQLRDRTAPLAAPHFAEHVLRQLPEGATLPPRLATTLDLELQRAAEGILEAHLRRIEDRNAQQGAAVVLDNRTGAVLAWVGSRDYSDTARLGANDGVLALRQPGSTLKPFVYGLYLERGGTAADMFADLPSQLPVKEGVYIPKNYDQRFHGPVSLRHALGSSLNVPAVLAAAEVGPDAVVDLLHRAGVTSLQRDPEDYGPGVALGNGEVRLLELTAAYAALGRKGRALTPQVLLKPPEPAAPTPPAEPLFSEETLATLLDVLSDDSARSVGYGEHGPLDMPFRVAAKTGTSTNFRDSWAVGLTPDYTIGVWVGNFDGLPMTRVAGGAGAAPILRQLFQALYPTAANPGDVRWFRTPKSLKQRTVCTLSGLPATPACPHTREELLPAPRLGASGPVGVGGVHTPGPDTCWMHAAVTVHPDDGLRATAGCSGDARTFTRVPPAWRAWAEAEGLTPPPDDFSPRCPPPTAEDRAALDRQRDAGAAYAAPVKLVHPLEGDEFARDFSQPAASQQLSLRALAPGDATLTFFVDGQPVGSAGPPWIVPWTLAPGSHTLGVGRGEVIEDEVHIQVR